MRQFMDKLPACAKAFFPFSLSAVSVCLFLKVFQSFLSPCSSEGYL